MTSPANSRQHLGPVEWPRQLITPAELAQELKAIARLRIVKAPLASKLILQFIGSWSYFLAHTLNKSKISNHQVLKEEVKRIELQVKPQSDVRASEDTKSESAPLLTISNHISCIDDPVLWASLLPLTYYSTNTDSVRWAAAAFEICFSKAWHSTFFSLGKTFPIIRGAGFNQPGFHFASYILKHNLWLHMFPEGRVMRDDNQQVISNKDRGYIFKWGVAKLILDHLKSTSNENSERNIRILPFYHLGMDQVLPIGWPYLPRIRKQITIFISPKVIQLNTKLLDQILAARQLYNPAHRTKSEDEIKRIKLTNFLEEEMEKLIEPTEKLHSLSN